MSACPECGTELEYTDGAGECPRCDQRSEGESADESLLDAVTRLRSLADDLTEPKPRAWYRSEADFAEELVDDALDTAIRIGTLQQFGEGTDTLVGSPALYAVDESSESDDFDPDRREWEKVDEESATQRYQSQVRIQFYAAAYNPNRYMSALSDYFSAISEIAVAINESEVDRWEERSQNFVEAKSRLEDSQDALSEYLESLNDVDLTGLPTDLRNRHRTYYWHQRGVERRVSELLEMVSRMIWIENGTVRAKLTDADLDLRERIPAQTEEIRDHMQVCADKFVEIYSYDESTAQEAGDGENAEDELDRLPGDVNDEIDDVLSDLP